jgi:hypothetical protein
VHPLAVHFCSEECKDDYMARLFSDRPALASDAVVKTEIRVARKAPAKTRRSASSGAKSRTRKKARAA